MTVVALKSFTIGGSDAAAACGIDPHRSRVMLWLEKTGRVERLPSEAMRWGTLLQPLIIEELVERGYTTADYREGEWSDEARPWLTGHVDGYVDDGDALSVLEVKTAGYWSHKWSGADVPVAYVAQCQHYLHLTGLDRALLACLVGGQRLELRTIERDQHAIEMLLTLEHDFYGYLVRDEPPAPDSSESAREALAVLYPDATAGRKVRLTPDEWKLVGELRARREQEKTIGEQVRELENQLKAVMGDAELAVSPFDTDALRWSNVNSTRLDTAALKDARPDVYAEFSTTTTTRRFSLL